MTNTNDSGPGSLRNAIETANNKDGADTIEVIATGTVELESELPELTTDMGIVGPGEDDFTVERGEGAPEFRIFTVREATVSVFGLTITNGVATECKENYVLCGGGISNIEGTLTIVGATVTGNTAEFGVGGGIGNLGTLTIEDCTITGNTADSNSGGGVANGLVDFQGTLTIIGSTISENTALGGGGIQNDSGSTLTVEDSTITGNSAYSAGTSGGGINNNDGSLTIEGSTVSGNTADRDGGGISSRNVSSGEMSPATTIINTTISGNSATDEGGGVHNSGPGRTVIEYSTIINNTASEGDGGGVASFAGDETITEVSSSIIAGNTNSDLDFFLPEFSERQPINTFESGGYNVIGDGNATDTFDATGDQVNVSDPGLQSLADNGGPTQTIALQEGSPALDAGSPDCPPLAVDQRGVDRPQGEGCDIGSFEFGAEPQLDGDQPSSNDGQDSGSDTGGDAGSSGNSGDSDEGSPQSDPEEEVEKAIRGHYEAIGEADFEEAYSYFGPTYKGKVSEEDWISEEESYDIEGSTIESIEVEEVSGGEASATVVVGFEDNTGTPQFEIFWGLVEVDGEWKLDEVADSEELG